jgi:signal transduction histidine kinase
VAWVTDLIDRYRYNLFYKTATHVVGLLIVLALVSIALFVWGIHYAQERTVSAISGQISQALVAGATTTPGSLPETIDAVKEDAYTYAFLGLVLLSILFGVLITRFALWPTRNSLQFQKRFIGNIAHEIRTPLAIIKTNTEVALFDPALKPEIRQVFEDTIVELDRISETINNLLSFDTLTRPRRMPFEPTDVGAIARGALERHKALADSRGVSLREDICDGCLVNGNAVALEQVVTNLVKNAVNYTPKDKDGVVTVTVAPDASKKVLVSVKDTGIGIGQKDLFHIFEPFYRGDTSRARGIGTGTSGLGLAIVNEIVRLHKGAISIRSRPNEGTEIRVLLPAASGASFVDPFASADKDDASEVSVDFS